MDAWQEVLIIVAITFFAVLSLWLLKEWKRQFMSGGLSKRNSKLLRAAARHASRTRQNGPESTQRNSPNLPQHIIVLPPPNFEVAVNYPSPIYVIDMEEPPPNYTAALNLGSTNPDTTISVTSNH